MKNNLYKGLGYILILFLLNISFSAFASLTEGTIDVSDKYASLCLDDNCLTTSRINFKTTSGNPVLINDTSITGHAWSETMGWINLNPSLGGVINTAEGYLSGYAWGEASGWINFSPTNGGVSINEDGQFVGYAWAQNYGWIKFDCSLPDSCLKTDWRPARVRPVEEGGSTSGSSNNPIPETVVDICPNVPGDQKLIPEGLVISAKGECIEPEQCNLIDGELKQPLDVMIVIDKSGSMAGNRINQAKNAAVAFIDNLVLGSDRVGYVEYEGRAVLKNNLSSSFIDTKKNIQAVRVGGMTNTGGAVDLAYQEIAKNGRRGVKNVIILLTDGESNISDIKGLTPNNYLLQKADLAKEKGIAIYTIGLGREISANLLKRVASTSDNYYASPTGEDLTNIYLKIAAIECTAKPSEVSGSVFYDKNFNAIKDLDESGFSSVDIHLINKDKDQPILKTESLQDGSFYFENVVRGEYLICVSPQIGLYQTFPSKNINDGCYSLTVIQGLDYMDNIFMISGEASEEIVEIIDSELPDLDLVDSVNDLDEFDLNNEQEQDVISNNENDGNNEENENDVFGKGISSSDQDFNLVQSFNNSVNQILEIGRGSLFNFMDLIKEFFNQNFVKILSKPIAIVGLGAGIYVNLISNIFANPISLSEIYFLPIKIWNLILLRIGLRKKRRPWGTVYDSVTKRPLDPAVVVLKDLTGKEIASSITDLDGRYGFLVPAGQYRIIVNKTNYSFPSEKLKNQEKDEFYQDLYFDELIEIKEGEIITKNIPMDPIRFDWNEFAKNKLNLMKFSYKRDLYLDYLSKTLFFLGLLLSLFILIIFPTFLNLLILFIYFVLFILKKTLLKTRVLGHIKQKINKNPLSFAIMRILFADSDHEVTRKVTDKTGKYYCLIPNGSYRAKIEKKNPDESYSFAHLSEPFEVKEGYLAKKFEI